MTSIFIGCAGWSLRKEFAEDFPDSGTHLERYARRFNCVEINSSFYKPHRESTYQRWAASTPDDFRFAVKLPKQITHIRRLVDVQPLIERFTAEINGLGQKLGAVLVQLPPSLAYKATVAEAFFRQMRSGIQAAIVCEPRHPTWFTSEAESQLVEHDIGRVAADPSVVPAAAVPAGCKRHVYYRWHGSPRIYYSAYDEPALHELAGQLITAANQSESVWCIFDNTAEGAATSNGLELTELIHARGRPGKATAPIHHLQQ